MKKRLDVEGDLRKFLRREITEEQYLNPTAEIRDIRGEAECRADIVTRGQGDKGAHRVLSVLLAYYGPSIYNIIAPELGEGAGIFEMYNDFAKEMTEQNGGQRVTLFDFIKEFFDIDLPTEKNE